MRRLGTLLALLLILTVPAAAQELVHKIGVFDAAVVFDRSQHGQTLKIEVERLRDLRLKEMTQAQTDLNALQQEIRTKELTFNDETRNEMLQKVNQQQIVLQRMNDDASREIQAEFNRAQQKLQRELLVVIDAVGQEGGYTMILEKGMTLFNSASVDITGMVLQRFDEMYPQNGTAAGSGE